MPGPRNQKKKKNAQSKKVDKKPPSPPSASQSPSPTPAPATPPPLTAPVHAHHVSDEALQESPPPVEQEIHEKYLPIYPQEEADAEPPISSALFKTPFIYDPGDGPRVKDPRAFLASRFAAPPSLDDAMCAEFAEEAVLQMLCTVLPEETALVRLSGMYNSLVDLIPTRCMLDSLVQQEQENGTNMPCVPETVPARRRPPRPSRRRQRGAAERDTVIALPCTRTGIQRSM